ncbi:hypothetical protein SCA6_000553 [Theobroma cacao]
MSHCFISSFICAHKRVTRVRVEIVKNKRQRALLYEMTQKRLLTSREVFLRSVAGPTLKS